MAGGADLDPLPEVGRAQLGGGDREALAGLTLTRETMLRLAVTVAELRAAYLRKGIEIGTARHPTPAQVEEVAAARRAFEEASATCEAVERVIERGYVNLPTG